MAISGRKFANLFLAFYTGIALFTQHVILSATLCNLGGHRACIELGLNGLGYVEAVSASGGFAGHAGGSMIYSYDY